MNKFLFLVLVALIWGNYSFAQETEEDDVLNTGISADADKFASDDIKEAKDINWNEIKPVPKTSGFDSSFDGGVSSAVNEAIDKANANVEKEKIKSAEEAEKQNPEAFRIKAR